jgi:PAS domain S-box-containing protein
MVESHRILILEDNPADAELVQFELQEAGLLFTATQVTTREDYLRNLQEFPPDLILSDYDLPHYNGALALADTRMRCPDTPFILVSGAVSEDRAIEILTQGAKDYVLKTRLQQRLVPAVRRALAEAAEQKARKEAEIELREMHVSLERQVADRTAALQKQIEHCRNVEDTLLKYNERLEILSYTASQLLVSDKPQQLVEELCRKVMTFLDCQVFFNFLVDEVTGRLHLNACTGIPPRKVREIEWLDFGVAVCGCVARDGLRIIAENIPETPDIRTDLIKSFGIKAYACHPLMHQQHVIGTLSFGTRTRTTFSMDDLAMMKAVTDQVAIAMSRVRMEDKMRQITERFEMAQHAAQVGTWDWNIVTGHIEWSTEMFNVFRIDPQKNRASFELWKSIIHPEDVIIAGLRIDEALQKKAILNSDYRIISPDGQIRWINAVGEGKYNDQNQAVRMIGICIDITKRKQTEEALRESEERYRELVYSSPEAVIVHSDGQFLYANPAALRLYGARSLDQLRQKTVLDLIPEDERTEIALRMEQWKAGERLSLKETKLTRLDGRVIEVESVGGAISYNGKPAVQVMIRDITQRKNREKEREKNNRTLRALSKSNQAMMRAVDEYKYIEEVCKIIVEDCGHAMVWAGYAEDDENKTVRPVAYNGFEEGYINSMRITWADTERGHGPTGTAIRTGKPTTCRNMQTDPLFMPWREEAIKRGYASSIVLPLITHGRTFGALNIYSKEPDLFTKEEENLLTELANDLSYGITAIRWREALRESEERFHAIATHTPDHILMQDRDLRYQLVINPQLGFAETDMLGKTDYDIFDRGDAEKLAMIKRQVMETGNSITMETSLLNLRGEPEYFEGAYVPRRGPSGKTDGIIGYFRNVTESKRTQEAILRAKKEWELTFDTVPDMIAILDNRHRIIRVNKAMANRLNVLPKNCVGMSCHEVVHGLSAPPAFCPHSLTCRDGQQHVAEFHEPCLGGDFLVSTSPLCDSSGNLIGSVHVARDITERKLVENRLAKQAVELQERTTQLEELNRELESFSYSVSHDLRAPLRAIDGFSRKLEREYAEKIDEKGAGTINVIRSNAKLMGVLIDNLLSFSRVQKTGMNIAAIDMGKLVKEVIKEIREANKERKLNFKVAKILPGCGDLTLIRQVLFNLLENAVKFTRNKRQSVIEMNSYMEDDKVVYCIKDNGAGFDMEYYNKLFGVFQRLHTHEEYEGTGVGLAIVQRIIQRHGGKVWAEGKIDRGAAFYFTLPKKL